MIDNALGTAPTWLRGDMHNHCEDHDLVLAHLEGAGEHLDFIALTNHAQKPIFFEQHHMVERIRAALPGLPVFFGLEWNAPAGTHAGVIFPPGAREAENAYAFARDHDRLGAPSAPDVETALAHLADLPAAERPIIFFNHPAPGQWNPESINRYLAADPNELIVGLEALHGHQAHAKIAALDPCTYPGAAVGGLADRVYATGQPFSLLLHSDFHVHKQARQPDYPLGAFNHTLVGVAEPTPAAIFAALRQGRTCAAQGHWLELEDFSVDGRSVGATWSGGSGTLRVAFAATEAIAAAELIGRYNAIDPPAVLARLGPRPDGATEWTVEIPAAARGFVRLRIIAQSPDRPAPGPPGPRHFLTSAILLDAGG